MFLFYAFLFFAAQGTILDETPFKDCDYVAPWTRERKRSNIQIWSESFGFK